MKIKSVTPFFFVLIAAVLVMPVAMNWIKGPAEVPGIFDEHYTLTQASALSQESGKPMLVLVTADWCPPCQKLKRTTLIDQTVVDWVIGNMVPVYLEDGKNKDEIGTLPVRSYPTTLIIQDGKVLASLAGAVGAERFITELSSVIVTTP